MVEPNPVDALAPGQIEEKAETIGEGKARMPRARQFILAVMAGIFIGMGALCMTIVKADSTFSFAVSQLLGGVVLIGCTYWYAFKGGKK